MTPPRRQGKSTEHVREEPRRAGRPRKKALKKSGFSDLLSNLPVKAGEFSLAVNSAANFAIPQVGELIVATPQCGGLFILGEIRKLTGDNFVC